jgi:alpha-tubulin suppressor-like RCC1 family protein
MGKRTVLNFTIDSPGSLSDFDFVAPAGVTSVRVVAYSPDVPSAVSAGFNYCQILTQSGLAMGWGNNNNFSGIIGDGTLISRSSPVAVLGGQTFQQILTAQSEEYTLALDTKGQCWSWGANTPVPYLGTGNLTNSGSATKVTGGLVFSKLYNFNSTNFGFTTGGQLYVWGDNGVGEAGIGSVGEVSSPTTLVGGLFFDNLFGSPGFSFGTTNSGQLWAWGGNSSGTLGDGTSVAKSSPVAVLGNLNWNTIAVGQSYAMGITASQQLYAWGVNTAGELGDGTVVAKSSPVLVLGGLTWKQIAISSLANTSYGITTSNDLYSWGFNGNGQIGNGNQTSQSSPVLVLGGLKFSQIIPHAQSQYAMGITTSGDMYGWGANVAGNLGDGTANSRSSPVLVLGGLKWSNVSLVGQGAPVTYGTTTTGAIYAWGSNGLGQVGDGTNGTNRSSPVLVLGGFTAMSHPGIVLSRQDIPVVPGTHYQINVGSNPSFGAIPIAGGQYVTRLQVVYG